jgi:hypothetical protein
VLVVTDIQLLQSATGSDDFGGTVSLFYSADGIVPFALVQKKDWQSVADWGDPGALDFGHYYGSETGNDSVYHGESSPSNVIVLE